MSLSTISALFHELTPLERVTLGTRAPAVWLVTGEDRLRVTVRNGAAGVTVRVSGRFLTADAIVQPFSFDLTPATDRSASSIDTALGDGWLLNLTARVAAGTPQPGDTFVVVDVVRGSGATAITLGTLLAQYVASIDAPAWPGSIVQSASDGAGAPAALVGADPAAGAEWSIAVPTGARFRVRSIVAQLVTDATVANREMTVRFTVGGVVVGVANTGVNQTASSTILYGGFAGAVRSVGAQPVTGVFPIPLLDLSAGDTITSVTVNVQAGDNYTAPVAYGEIFLDV